MPDTYFGHESVSTDEKKERVNHVFDQVSDVYDSMNDAMSLGIHRLWKRQAVLSLDCSESDVVADLSCGTGDISQLILPSIPYGKLYCIDPNAKMLEVCKTRLEKRSNPNIQFVQSSAEALSLPEKLDKLIVSFGIRNFSDEIKGLERIYQSMKAGGKIVIMEFNPPESGAFETQYSIYLKYVIPCLGSLLGQSKSSYQYLADSIAMQPTPEQRIKTLESVGFEFIKHTPLTMGVIGLFECYRCK
ncbi:ubiquinone/menaquinone biosynthesis methyltransferase [Candidatus Synchoanobacter obligatus]|uniref:Ubiquinone/menaquinone biosynthesis C-methyltransferase UbiE n=1 Tax=Candidatus Synchoanobacter obligatus TaxID=2919597 RepID=A0ABT1L5B5_9GAMM|nr:ubiquinone/menaquinone biosynthesis methyltransferase [Candidatus Synchoanobacter obligatus]MCP8351915.1 ubiquinone/menaquinone biosynthesis methyltransferase [Candidatus Synchoanobacter obligatus]